MTTGLCKIMMDARENRRTRTGGFYITVTGSSTSLSARLYGQAPAETKQQTLMVFFHGGGFVAGDLEEADEFLSSIVARNPGLLILAAGYTLAGASAFPAAAEDAYAVLEWAASNKSTIGWSGRHLVVAGIEAGANLATVSNLIAHDRNGPKVSGQILVAPMLDPSLSSESMRAYTEGSASQALTCACEASYRCYLPNVADRMHPYASPLYSSRLKSMAPTLIFSIDVDPLRDEAEQYGAKLRSSGVRTVMARLDTSSAESGSRTELAVTGGVVDKISAFLATLSTPLHVA